jgi:hypothetical protein
MDLKAQILIVPPLKDAGKNSRKRKPLFSRSAPTCSRADNTATLNGDSARTVPSARRVAARAPRVTPSARR